MKDFYVDLTAREVLSKICNAAGSGYGPFNLDLGSAKSMEQSVIDALSANIINLKGEENGLFYGKFMGNVDSHRNFLSCG